MKEFQIWGVGYRNGEESSRHLNIWYKVKTLKHKYRTQKRSLDCRSLRSIVSLTLIQTDSSWILSPWKLLSPMKSSWPRILSYKSIITLFLQTSLSCFSFHLSHCSFYLLCLPTFCPSFPKLENSFSIYHQAFLLPSNTLSLSILIRLITFK